MAAFISFVHGRRLPCSVQGWLSWAFRAFIRAASASSASASFLASHASDFTFALGCGRSDEKTVPSKRGTAQRKGLHFWHAGLSDGERSPMSNITLPAVSSATGGESGLRKSGCHGTDEVLYMVGVGQSILRLGLLHA